VSSLGEAREASPRDARQTDPAAERGLRRQRRRAPCPPIQATPLPTPPTAVELLALITRVRSVKVAIGELDAGRLYDLRSFKSTWAELAYLHRLAAGGRHGGTVVTSMRQLVTGVAPLHPAWKLSGDRWEDRDRHHSAVRRRLSTLAAAQLLRWRVGLDEDLEERRTELELRPVPELRDEELATAAAKLARWEARYGPQLNTPSPIAISDVKQAAAPLSATERQRRGCERARRSAQARRRDRASQTITAPPFGTPTTPENNNLEFSSNQPQLRHVYENRTRAGAHEDALRSSHTATPTRPGKAATKNQGSKASGPSSDWQQEILERVEARRAIFALREQQAIRRATEVASWSIEREWPTIRLKEAWVVARHEATEAALHGGRAAGPLARGPRNDYVALRRAVARYERNHPAAPDGYPAGGLAALLHLGVLARESSDQNGPMLLAYAIGALDQLSRRMRALNTANSTPRTARQVARAKARHSKSETSGPLTFRTRAWPPWVVLDTAGIPELTLTDRFQDALVTRPPGPPSWEIEREVLRDALLLRNGTLPPELDGRTAMAQRSRGEMPAADRRAASLAGELAQLTGLPARQLSKFTPEQLGGMLERARAAQRRDQQRANEHRQTEQS
jgi:hypothetical protein